MAGEITPACSCAAFRRRTVERRMVLGEAQLIKPQPSSEGEVYVLKKEKAPPHTLLCCYAAVSTSAHRRWTGQHHGFTPIDGQRRDGDCRVTASSERELICQWRSSRACASPFAKAAAPSVPVLSQDRGLSAILIYGVRGWRKCYPRKTSL